MKLIYIEATAEEIKANKTLADTLGEALSGFCESIIKIKPVIEKEYKFADGEEEERGES